MNASQNSQKATHRPVKPLSSQLLDHASVLLEEQLYSQAFALLSSGLTSGTSTSQPAAIPPIQHLALAATLVVHPQLTSRTTAQDRHQAADDALHYLRQVLKITGPRNSELDKAFEFKEKTHSSHRTKRVKTRRSDFSAGVDDEEATRLRLTYVDKESIWQNADDFWCIVGWAFNCSVAHRHRWRRWKVWLDFMLDVLAADLEMHAEESTVEQSMLARYLQPVGQGRNNKRRLMRAILADGKQKALAEFHEIWRNETRLPKPDKQEAALGKKRKLDIDNNEYGDYFDEDSDADSPATSARQSRSATTAPSAKQSRQTAEDDEDSSDDEAATKSGKIKTGDIALAIESYGGIDSIHLRQRLLTLLVRFCHLSPLTFLDTEDLFDLFTEFIRPLPLAVFQHFACPTKPYLDPHAQSSLNQMLLRPLLSGSAPEYRDNALTQRDFEEHYGEYAANSTASVDNAKVSLVLEALMRLLWRTGGLVYSEQFRRTVEKGIEERREKVAFDGRKKTGFRALQDGEAQLVLEASGERMRVVLGLLKT